MKRYPVFALIALLFLLLVLLGSWVYLEHYPWLSGEREQEHSASGDAGEHGRDSSDLMVEADAGEAGETDGNAGTGKGGPLEAPPEPFRRANPPDPIETGGKVKDAETAGDKTGDTVVAELTPGLAAIRDGGDGEDDIEAFIVSTLQPAAWRASISASRTVPSAPKSLLGASEDEAVGYAYQFDRQLTGQLLWPTMTAADKKDLKEAGRRQAVVYFSELPEFRCLVDADDGWFSVPMTERMEKDYRAKGLQLVVHSPVFQISGGFEAITLKKDDGKPQVRLEVAPVIEVTVDLTPPEAVESGVRVWLERRGLPETPDYDDGLYMSAKAPSSGRLVFTVPEHYGEFRIGATGESWHSGLAQIITPRKWKDNRVKVVLALASEPCDLASGKVKVDADTPLKAARLESTHYGTTVYSGPDGSFSMYVPFDSYQSNRQFIVTAAKLRPEVVPLEARAEGSPGVEGTGPNGPFTVSMASKIALELRLPKDATRIGRYLLREVPMDANIASGENQVSVDLPWGLQVLTVQSVDSRAVFTVWISAADWQRLFKAYAAGKEGNFEQEPELLKDVFKKR